MFKPRNKLSERGGAIMCSVFLLIFFIGAAQVGAQMDIANTGLDDSAAEAHLSDYSGDLPTAIGSIVGGFLAFIGVIFFVLMIYGGFLWMTARGNEQQVSKAKDLIISAIVGIVIIFAAYAITLMIGSALTTT